MTAAKAVVAAIGVVVTALSTALADNAFNSGEAGTIAAAVVTGTLTVYGVWRTPNTPK